MQPTRRHSFVVVLATALVLAVLLPGAATAGTKSQPFSAHGTVYSSPGGPIAGPFPAGASVQIGSVTVSNLSPEDTTIVVFAVQMLSETGTCANQALLARVELTGRTVLPGRSTVHLNYPLPLDVLGSPLGGLPSYPICLFVSHGGEVTGSVTATIVGQMTKP
jgi:hypothetical protein